MSLFEALIPAIASIGGAALGAVGNSKAASTSSKYAKKALELEREKLAEARTIYEDEKAQAEPAVSYLRQVVATPVGGLYPDQLAAQEEVRRQGLNDISRSGLRGSGRAVTAALKRIDSDFVNGAMAQNRQNRLSAAGGLAGQSFAASNNIANSLVNEGAAEANTVNSIGTNNANSSLANFQLAGGALGEIGSAIAQELKRPSAYEGLDIPGRSSTGTVNSETGQFGHLARGGVVRRGLHAVVGC